MCIRITWSPNKNTIDQHRDKQTKYNITSLAWQNHFTYKSADSTKLGCLDKIDRQIDRKQENTIEHIKIKRKIE